jgi:hypothetical protein
VTCGQIVTSVQKTSYNIISYGNCVVGINTLEKRLKS